MIPSCRHSVIIADTGLRAEGQSPACRRSRPPRTRKKQRKAALAAASAAAPLPTSAPNVLLWLRQDLRLHDNAALVAAAQQAKASGGNLTLVYVHSPEGDGDDVRTGDPLDRALVLDCVVLWEDHYVDLSFWLGFRA